MTMEREGDVPNVGKTQMKMKVTSKRIGDCP